MAQKVEKLRCTKEPYIEDIGPRRVKSIHFDAFSGEEIKKSAEVQIWTNAIYDQTGFKPVENGLIDQRMGPANKKLVCATCHGNFSDCPGHFGYLKLTLPVFNVGYVNSILNILKCICKGCGRIILPDELRREYLMKMRNPKAEVHQKNAIMKIFRPKCKGRCHHCGYVNGTVNKPKTALAFVETFNNTADGSVEECHAALSHQKEKASFQPLHLFLPNKVIALFKKIPDEDCELLNLRVRPEKLIVTDIAIPPAPVRPSAVVGGGQSNEDSLTSTLRNIINQNAIIREDLEVAAPMYKCLMEFYCTHSARNSEQYGTTIVNCKCLLADILSYK